MHWDSFKAQEDQRDSAASRAGGAGLTVKPRPGVTHNLIGDSLIGMIGIEFNLND